MKITVVAAISSQNFCVVRALIELNNEVHCSFVNVIYSKCDTVETLDLNYFHLCDEELFCSLN